MLFLPHYCFKKLKINKSKITLKYFQPSLSKLIDWLRVVRGKFQRFTNNKKPINMNNIGKCIGYGIYAVNNSAGFRFTLLKTKKSLIKFYLFFFFNKKNL